MASPGGARRWYLSFDCATKTLAFSLMAFDIRSLRRRVPDLRRKCAEYSAYLRDLQAQIKTALITPAKPLPQVVCENISRVKNAIAAINAELAQYVELVDGETVDLCPGIADKDIHTVPRVQALIPYIESRVMPAVAKHCGGDSIIVLVEFQMGVNAPSRVIASSLITLFIKHDVRIVGPSLKNKISLFDSGKYCFYIEKYTTLYTANKAHTKANLEYFVNTFNCGHVLKTTPKKYWGHIADSLCQIFGEACDENEDGSFPVMF
jgi:hypothetical protein